MSPRSRRLQFVENRRQYLRLEQPKRFRRHLELVLGIGFQPLLLGLLAKVFGNLFLKLAKLIGVLGAGEILHLFHVDVAELPRRFGFLELLEQLVDRIEFFLDLQSLRHRHLRAAGELVLRDEFVDLVLVAEFLHELDDVFRELGVILARAVIQIFEVAKLLFRNGFLEFLDELFGRHDRIGLLRVG